MKQNLGKSNSKAQPGGGLKGLKPTPQQSEYSYLFS